MAKPEHVLFVGANGMIGQLAVAQAVAQGYKVRALVRDKYKTDFGPGVEVVEGDLKLVRDLGDALEGMDAVVFTQGSHDGEYEAVDYGAVRNALLALDGRKIRIVLMTSIGDTTDQDKPVLNWKRRGENLVRASENEYTIVRPGWFNMNGADEKKLVFAQGDRKRTDSPEDGSVSAVALASVLVDALGSEGAIGKTFELISDKGEEQSRDEIDSMFAELKADRKGEYTGVDDEFEFKLADEPDQVKIDFDEVLALCNEPGMRAAQFDENQADKDALSFTGR